MNCPHCEVECNGIVLETRKLENSIIRKRACGSCGKSFYSREVSDITLVLHRPRPDKIAKREAERAAKVGAKVTSIEAFRAWR